MPAVGLGTWKSPLGKTKDAVVHAIKSGYRMIDTANDYGNEHEVGQAIKECIDSGIVKREDLFIQSKLWNTNHRREHVKADLVATLEDLQLDYIDSFVIHWPQACPAAGALGICRAPAQNKPYKFSEQSTTMFPMQDNGLYCSENECHYVETWHAMEDLVDEGLCRSIGISNFNSEQIREILSIAKKHRPQVLQNECHVYLQQKDLVDLCKASGIIFQAYSPLASADSPFRKDGDRSLFTEDAILFIAQKHKKTPAQVALRWNIQRGVSVVPKSVTPSRIEANLDVSGFDLDEADKEKMDTLNIGFRHCAWRETSLHPDYPFKNEIPHGFVVPRADGLKTSGKDY